MSEPSATLPRVPRNRSSLIKTFNMLDVDKSGTIDAEELKSPLKSMAQPCSDNHIAKLFEAEGFVYDPSTSSIDWDTFVNMMGKPLKKNVLIEIFHAVDLDGSDYITTAEMQHFLANIGLILDDDDGSQLMRMYDENGDGRITFDEFVKIVEDLGFPIDWESFKAPDIELIMQEKVQEQTVEENKEEEWTPKLIALSSIEDQDLRNALAPFDTKGDGMIDLGHVRKAAEGKTETKLHWSDQRPSGGLSEHVKSVNHIAILVSDVSRSTSFYRNVIGLEQIRRPNFDSHGAWFTMGNCELHLIKGKPVVHKGDDLIVGHISLDAENIGGVLEKLQKMKVPFRVNTSVPAGADAGTMNTNENNDMMSTKIVTQFFLRDPDGYYLEICNCDEVLTEYCLGKKATIAGYQEGALKLNHLATTLGIMNAWVSMLNKKKFGLEQLYIKVKDTDGSIAEVSALLGCTRANEVNKGLLKTFMDRRSIYGDVCQNEEEADMEEILLSSGNNATKAEYIIKLREKYRGVTIFRPPAVFNADGTKYMPPAIFRKNDD